MICLLKLAKTHLDGPASDVGECVTWALQDSSCSCWEQCSTNVHWLSWVGIKVLSIFYVHADFGVFFIPFIERGMWKLPAVCVDLSVQCVGSVHLCFICLVGNVIRYSRTYDAVSSSWTDPMVVLALSSHAPCLTPEWCQCNHAWLKMDAIFTLLIIHITADKTLRLWGEFFLMLPPTNCGHFEWTICLCTLVSSFVKWGIKIIVTAHRVVVRMKQRRQSSWAMSGAF